MKFKKRMNNEKQSSPAHLFAGRLIIMWSALLFCLLYWGNLGCGGRPSIYNEQLNISGPIVVGPHLAYLDKTRERIVLLRPFTGEVRHVKVGRRPVFMMPAPSQRELLVVCKGWVAEEQGEDDEEPSLVLIETESGESISYSLESPFDEVAVSSDNKYALAYFSASAGPGDNEVFRNPNATAILNLETGEIVHKTVRSFGDVPRGVLFSPPNMAPMKADGTLGEPRSLAVVFAEGYLTFLDITNPERREVTVRLTLPEMGSQDMIGQQMVFVPSAGNAFLRVSFSSDIYTFSFMERETNEPWENDFVLSVNTLAAGSVPGDIAVFDQDDEQKLLVANYSSKDIVVIDAYTSQFKSIPVGTSVDRIILHPESNPTTAIVYSKGYPQAKVHFLELWDLEEKMGRNLDTLHTSQPILSIEKIHGQNRFLVIHDDSRSVMSVLNPEEQTLSPLTAHSSLSGYTVNSSGTILAGYTGGSNQLGLVNMADLSVRTLVLAHEPRRLLALRRAPDADPDQEMNTIVVDHGEKLGLLTVISNPVTADRASTFVMSGFMLKDILDDRLE